MARQLDRWAPLGGIIFVVLMIVGTTFVADVPDPDAPQQQLATYLADSGNHTRNLMGAYIWVVGALAFLWFVTGLRSVLRGAEGGTGALSNLVFGAGVVFAAVWMVSAAAFAAVAYAVGLRGATVSDPDFVKVLPQMAWMILLLGGRLRSTAPGSHHLHPELANRCPPTMARLARHRRRDRVAVRCDLHQHWPVPPLGAGCFHRPAPATRHDNRNCCRVAARARRLR
jgi:hypothetical protein